MREDGIELDRILLVNRKDYRPEGIGPVSSVKSGQLPKSFPFVEPEPFTSAKAEPIQTLSGPIADGVASLRATDFTIEGKGYYVDKSKWLAINPIQNQEASAQAAFPFASGSYHLTLQAIGENDGSSTYRVSCNGALIGEHTCPLSTETFEEGNKFHATWKSFTVRQGDVIEVSSKIGSKDGKEFSRARWAAVDFKPADDATTKALAAMAISSTKKASSAPTQPNGPPVVLPRQPNGNGSVNISGELKRWHKVTLTLDGPFAHEQDNAPNPFTDVNFSVTYTHESGMPTYVVPGYFAADGNASESGAKSGTKWRAHLSPDITGKWNYRIGFDVGTQAGLGLKGKPDATFAGKAGSFTIADTDKTASDFRSKGRLQYVGGHYLRHAGSGEYFLKATSWNL